MNKDASAQRIYLPFIYRGNALLIIEVIHWMYLSHIICK